MNQPTIQSDQTLHSYFPMGRLALGLLSLLMWCNAVALAQTGGESGNSTGPDSIRVTHLLGFESAPSNANGTLAIQGSVLQFQKNDRAPVQIEIASIQDVVLGEQSRQVGGVPMTLGKAAAPFGGGRVVSLFSHKKYDTLALEYVDANGGVHGAIFQLKKGQGEVLRNELMAKGAHVSHGEDKLPKPDTTEVRNEGK